MFEKITEAEINERSMANVSTTPNRPTAFGESKMDAQALKLRFDRLGRYLAGRINEIFAGISDGNLAKTVKIVEEKGEETIEYSLAEFILKMIEGDLTQINVKVPEGTQRLDVICNQVLRWQNEIKTGDFADETVVVQGVTIRQFYEEFKKLEETGQGKPGEPGKSAYDYAVEGGYQGTEEEFAKKLATEYPSKVSQLENDEKYITALGAPVQTVNGKAGNVSLSAADVGARPNTWMPSYSDVNADKAGTAQSLVSGHNTSTDSHNDIHLLIQGLSDRINAVLDSDDTTLDELSEIVAYIKSNKTLIDSITTSKVNVADIIDNLTTNVKDKPLSAAQGVALKALIDALDTDKLDASALTNAINTALAQAKASGEFDGADGKTPYIQNGYWYIDGVNTNVQAQGDNGKSAYQYALDGGYNGTEAAFSQDINPDTMKAELNAYMVEEFAKRQQLKPEFANSVEDMTDTSKVYVLCETNEIWGYKKNLIIHPETNFNVFNKGEAIINKRMSTSGSISTTNGAKGSFITNYIELTNWANASSPYNMNINFVLQSVSLAATTAVFYDEGKTYIGGVTCGITNNAKNITLRDTESVIDLKYNAQATNNLVDYPNAKYVRIQLFKKESTNALVASDLDDVEITLDANKTPEHVTEEYGWGSTGHTFVPADYENRIVDLENDVNRLSADVINLQNNCGAGGSNVTIPSWWENAVEKCIAKIKALQVNRNCVTFPFFSDNHQRNGYAGVLIAKIMKECGIPYCFFGGDTIGSSYLADEATMIAQDKAFDNTMAYIPDGKFCRAVGNHDGYWAVSSTERYGYTKAQVYELFLRAEGTAQNKHFGGEGTYYYVDDAASKVRWIVLDTNPEPIGSTAEIIDNTQLEWFQNTALSFNESGWGVVIISHCPIANPYHANVTNAVEVIDIMKSYMSSTDDNKADVIGWYSGHIHRDRIYTNLYVNGDSLGYVGEPDISLGFTQVTITSDRTDIAYKNDDLTESATKHPIDDSDQSHAIDFVTINKSTRTVNITRLGIGEDRSYTY